MKQRKVPRASLVAGFALAVGLGVACYGPTEMRIEVSTDFACTNANGQPTAVIQTSIAVGATVADALVAAETANCGPGTGRGGDHDIGSLVILPSGARDAHVTVQVTMTTDGGRTEDCKQLASGDLPGNCIVARRTFAFIRHTARTVPIKMYANCAGKFCAGETTCNSARDCESAEVQECGDIGSNCASDGGPPPPVDGAADAPVADSGDAGPPPTCPVRPANTLVTSPPFDGSELLAANTTSLFWSVRSTATSPKYVVRQILKTGGTSEMLSNFPESTKPYTAMAADDESVWVAAGPEVLRYDLNNKQVSPSLMQSGDVHAIAFAHGATNTTVYLATTETATGGSRELFVAEAPAWTPTLVTNGKGGIAAAASASRVYVLDGVALLRHAPPAPGASPESFAALDGVDIAEQGGSAFFSTRTASPGGIFRLDDDAGVGMSPSRITTGKGLGRLAVDGSFVYYLRHGLTGESATYAGVLRSEKVGGKTAPVPVAQGFEDVHGLAIDAACVYFFGLKAGFGTSLYAYPLVPAASVSQ